MCRVIGKGAVESSRAAATAATSGGAISKPGGCLLFSAEVQLDLDPTLAATKVVSMQDQRGERET